jgi:hypothetical protein
VHSAPVVGISAELRKRRGGGQPARVTRPDLVDPVDSIAGFAGEVDSPGY